MNDQADASPTRQDRDLIATALGRHAHRRSRRGHGKNHRARPPHRPRDRNRARRGDRDRLRHVHRESRRRTEAAGFAKRSKNRAARRQRDPRNASGWTTRFAGSKKRKSARFTASAPTCCANVPSRRASIRCLRCSQSRRRAACTMRRFRRGFRSSSRILPRGFSARFGVRASRDSGLAREQRGRSGRAAAQCRLGADSVARLRRATGSGRRSIASAASMRSCSGCASSPTSRTIPRISTTPSTSTPGRRGSSAKRSCGRRMSRRAITAGSKGRSSISAGIASFDRRARAAASTIGPACSGKTSPARATSCRPSSPASRPTPTPISPRCCAKSCARARTRTSRRRRRPARSTFSTCFSRRAIWFETTREVRRSFQQRFKRLFVDEFQDTDPLQAEILLLLAADDPAVADWRKVRPVPGKLFIVGDPKQSIYRFRRADVGIYRGVYEMLEAAGAKRVTLRTSFRAQAEHSAHDQRVVRAGDDREIATRRRPATCRSSRSGPIRRSSHPSSCFPSRSRTANSGSPTHQSRSRFPMPSARSWIG